MDLALARRGEKILIGQPLLNQRVAIKAAIHQVNRAIGEQLDAAQDDRVVPRALNDRQDLDGTDVLGRMDHVGPDHPAADRLVVDLRAVVPQNLVLVSARFDFIPQRLALLEGEKFAVEPASRPASCA